MKIFKNILIAACLFIPALLFAETVDINTADKESLMLIKGIGEKRAEAIIAYREENGLFESVEELAEVRGIGPSVIEKNIEILKINHLPEKIVTDE